MQNSKETEILRETIASFLLTQWPSRSAEKHALLSSKNLFTDGWLDSVIQVRLVVYLDRVTKKKVPAFRFSRNTFQSIEDIANLYI